MVGLLKQLECHPVREEPRVWISRLAIYEQIEPELKKIQDVPLKRGLNIICANETADNSQTGFIAGHSAGKTTLCRFIRYVLGESYFAPDRTTALIKDSIPDGWIAGEIHVQGVKWAVRRPFCGKFSFVLKNASIDELLKQGGTKVNNSNYVETLGFSNTLDGMQCKVVEPAKELISWGHVLSWCARDQEARLSNLYEWRAISSNSGSPSFSKPKVGSLFAMRALLDLLQKKEVESEKKLGELDRDWKLSKSIIEKKSMEPKIGVEMYENALRNELNAQFSIVDIKNLPFDSEIATDITVRSITKKESNKLFDLLRELTKEADSIQQEINDQNNLLNEKQKKIRPFTIQIRIFQDKLNELITGVKKSTDALEELEELLKQSCEWGDVLINNCNYVQRKYTDFKRAVDDIGIQRNRTDVEKEIAKLNVFIGPVEREIAEIESIIGDLNANKKSKSKQYDTILLERDRLSRLLDDVEFYRKELSSPSENKELERLCSRVRELETEIKQEQEKLQNLQREFEQSSKLLSSVFSGILKRLLNAQYSDGKVILEEGNIAFKIIQGQELGGEAINTLSILLADLSCMIYNTLQDKSNLPDFLLHDSPREADMGANLYSNYLRLAANIQEEYGNNCPFQYIVTTTTPPPDDIRKFVVLTISAHPENEMLLKQQLKDNQLQIGF